MSAKPKKPKARRMWVGPEFPHLRCTLIHGHEVPRTIPVAVLDVSDEAALIDLLVEEFGRGMSRNTASYHDGMRAALTALGVLPKRRGK